MIEEKDFATLDMRYKKADDCNDDMTKALTERHDLEIKIEKGLEKMNVLIAILGAIAVPVLGVCIKSLFGG